MSETRLPSVYFKKPGHVNETTGGNGPASGTIVSGVPVPESFDAERQAHREAVEQNQQRHQEAIDRLQKVKEALLGSGNQLRLANDKATALTVKKE